MAARAIVNTKAFQITHEQKFRLGLGLGLEFKVMDRVRAMF